MTFCKKQNSKDISQSPGIRDGGEVYYKEVLENVGRDDRIVLYLDCSVDYMMVDFILYKLCLNT